jgi:NAD(P)H-flavin reductase
VPPGIASTWIHDTLEPGDRVWLSDPAGALWSEGDATGPLLLIAGGSGVSPFAGLLEHLFEQRLHEKRPIYLFFGARERRDLLLDARFRAWARAYSNFHYVPVLSNSAPGDNWQGETGFVNEAVARRFPRLPDAAAAIAGSPAMIRATLETLTSIGVPKERIRHDPVPGP